MWSYVPALQGPEGSLTSQKFQVHSLPLVSPVATRTTIVRCHIGSGQPPLGEQGDFGKTKLVGNLVCTAKNPGPFRFFFPFPFSLFPSPLSSPPSFLLIVLKIGAFEEGSALLATASPALALYLDKKLVPSNVNVRAKKPTDKTRLNKHGT